MTVARDQLFHQKPPGSRFRFSRTGVQPPPGSSTIELPPAFAESSAYPPDRELPGSPRQCSLPLACRHPPEGHQIGGARKRGANNLKTPSLANHTAAASQPTGRIAKTASWIHLSRVSPPAGPTPAGKTLPHSYPKTSACLNFYLEKGSVFLSLVDREVEFCAPTN